MLRSFAAWLMYGDAFAATVPDPSLTSSPDSISPPLSASVPPEGTVTVPGPSSSPDSVSEEALNPVATESVPLTSRLPALVDLPEASVRVSEPLMSRPPWLVRPSMLCVLLSSTGKLLAPLWMHAQSFEPGTWLALQLAASDQSELSVPVHVSVHTPLAAVTVSVAADA